MDDIKFLMINTRARVYAVWGMLVTAGFVATHFYQQRGINVVWTVILAVAFYYMWRVMPLTVHQMRKIYVSWAVPMALGMLVSAAVFYVNGLAPLIGYLGAF